MRLKLSLLLFLLLCGCSPARHEVVRYGISPSGTAQSLPIPILLEAIDSAPAYLHNDLLYRLDYAGSELRPYANSRWSTSPDLMLASMLHHAGGDKLLALGQSPQRAPCALRIGLTAFEQVFSDAENSHAEIGIDFSLMQLRNRRELKHGSLRLDIPAETADARGGAQALERAGRQAAERVIKWLNEQLADPAPGKNPVRAACTG